MREIKESKLRHSAARPHMLCKGTVFFQVKENSFQKIPLFPHTLVINSRHVQDSYKELKIEAIENSFSSGNL